MVLVITLTLAVSAGLLACHPGRVDDARPEAVPPDSHQDRHQASQPEREYVERLGPAPWVWLSALSVAASSGLVVLTAFGGRVAVIVALASMGLVGWALLASSAVITVRDGQLVAGRARIPVRFVGSVHELDKAAMSALRGPRGDARAYLCQRGWISGGVAVEITDTQDPVPYWLLSSRRPRMLAQAIRAAAPGQAHSRQIS